MPTLHLCSICGGCHYETFCRMKPRKPIAKIGKRAKEYEMFKRKVARPYLDKKYGRKCSINLCNETTYLDIHHIKTRGSSASSKMDLENLVYLCRYHHSLVTDGKLKI